jgi:hypothetical protein
MWSIEDETNSDSFVETAAEDREQWLRESWSIAPSKVLGVSITIMCPFWNFRSGSPLSGPPEEYVMEKA